MCKGTEAGKGHGEGESSRAGLGKGALSEFLRISYFRNWGLQILGWLSEIFQR